MSGLSDDGVPVRTPETGPPARLVVIRGLAAAELDRRGEDGAAWSAAKLKDAHLVGGAIYLPPALVVHVRDRLGAAWWAAEGLEVRAWGEHSPPLTADHREPQRGGEGASAPVGGAPVEVGARSPDGADGGEGAPDTEASPPRDLGPDLRALAATLEAGSRDLPPRDGRSRLDLRAIEAQLAERRRARIAASGGAGS